MTQSVNSSEVKLFCGNTHPIKNNRNLLEQVCNISSSNLETCSSNDSSSQQNIATGKICSLITTESAHCTQSITYPSVYFSYPVLYFYSSPHHLPYSFQPIPFDLCKDDLEGEDSYVDYSSRFSFTHYIPSTYMNPQVIPKETSIVRSPQEAPMAVSMGYYGYQDDWKHPSRRLTLLCPQNKVRVIRDGWLLMPFTTYREWIKPYNTFKKNNVCLKCNRHCILPFSQAYCRSCFCEIRRDNHCHVTSVIMSSFHLNQVKHFFKFLLDIPEVNSYFGVCSQCHTRVFHIWFHGYRNICIDCVIKMHNLKYPKGKYLNCDEDDLDEIINSYEIE